uniref:Putative chloride channel toxin Tx12 n=1 Tax=Buthus israelis TaxID=2899555 RepID=B8XH27_BUTIS|nr:putative chloride channel toxin Tx12 [Buthus occitanus israelis]
MKFLYGIIFVALFLTVMLATHIEGLISCTTCFSTTPNMDKICSNCCRNKGGGTCKGSYCVCRIQY